MICRRFLVSFCISLFFSSLIFAAEKNTAPQVLRVAAASDLRFALPPLVKSFEQAHPGNTVDVVYGSSGKFTTQIQQNAPFDVFLSADEEYPKILLKEGHASSKVFSYATGRLAVWQISAANNETWKGQEATDQELKAALKSDERVRLAIANPSHAPYGKRAVELLLNLDVQKGSYDSGTWKGVVLGDNVSHAAKLAQTGNAKTGVIALSLAMSDELRKQGRYLIVPQWFHSPLVQGMVVTKLGAGNQASPKFVDWIVSPKSQALMLEFGFESPPKRSAGTNLRSFEAK